MNSSIGKSIRNRTISITNRDLLIAASEGDLGKIELLIKDGADVNYIDRDGNTALHYAVHGNKSEIVDFLLSHMEDTNVENSENETPFDIAHKLNNRNILTALGNQIVENSRRFLEKNNPKRTEATLKQNDPALTRIPTVLDRRISQTEDKITHCLHCLREINKDDSNSLELTYEKANIIVYFIEALALVGSGDKLKDWMKDYFSICCPEEDRIILSEARKEFLGEYKGLTKKFYLTDIHKFIKCDDINYAFKKLENYLEKACDKLNRNRYAKHFIYLLYWLNSEEKSTGNIYDGSSSKTLLKQELQALVNEASEQCTTASNETNSNTTEKLLTYIECLNAEDADVEDIKKDICSFLENERKKLKVPKHGGKAKTKAKCPDAEEIKLCSVLNDMRTITAGQTIDVKSFLKEEFEKLIKSAYLHEKMTPEELFNFTVNFEPVFRREISTREFREVRDLRDNLIHEFHKYDYAEFGNQLRSLRGRLVKYYFAQEVRSVLKGILEKPAMNSTTIKQNLQVAMDNFKTEFKRDCATERVIPEAEEKGLFGYKFSQSMFPERDDDVEVLVDQYFKFMVILDCEKSADDSLNDAESEEVSLAREHARNTRFDRKELNDVKRRQIFEDFCKLRRMKKCCSRGYDEEKAKLRTELVAYYGVNGDDFDTICTLYIEGSHEFKSKYQNTVKEFAKIINNLKKVKDKYKLSSQIIVSLCDHSTKKESDFDRSGCQNALEENIGLGLEEIQNELPEDKRIELLIGGEPFYIHSSKFIINNMLKTFYNAYNEYREEFDIEEMFNDEVFLCYLVKSGKEDKASEKFLMIKKLLDIEYTAPYVAKLIAELKSDEMVEQSDLTKLIEILLKKGGLYVNYLYNLLEEISAAQPGIYGKVLAPIFDENVNIVRLCPMLKEPRHAEGFLLTLNEKIMQSEGSDRNKILKLIIRTLQLLNYTSYELYCNGNYPVALKILHEARIQQDKLIQEDFLDANDVNVLRSMYQKGRINNKQGCKTIDHAAKMELHGEALDVFYAMKDSLLPEMGHATRYDEKVMFLLVLSDIAYTKSYMNKHEESCKEYEVLYEDVIKHALNLGHESNVPENVLNDEHYDEIATSKRYQELLSFSNESKKYLDILNIKDSIAYNKVALGIKELSKENYISAPRNFEQALEVYKEIYHYAKRRFGLRNKVTVRALRHASYVNNRIGQLWSRKNCAETEEALHYCQLALQSYYMALLKSCGVYKIQLEMYWPSHPAVMRSRKIVISGMRDIAYAFGSIGGKKSNEERREHFEKARDLYRILYDILKNGPEGEEDTSTLKTGLCIVYTERKLGNLEYSREMCENILHKQKRLLGDTHPGTKKTEGLLQELNMLINRRHSRNPVGLRMKF